MFHFVANLKPYTWYRGQGNRRFGAYLLSIDHAQEHRELAASVVRSGPLLCADNGNVDRIRALLQGFKDKVAPLDLRRRGEERSLRRYARPGDLSMSLTSSYRGVVDEIRIASRAAINAAEVRRTIEEQGRLAPSYLIGMEDFTLATMTGLSIEPEYARIPARTYAALARRASRYASDTIRGRYGDVGNARVFAGMHAIDFDTAIAAGWAAGAAGAQGIATGLVGALRDNNHADYRVVDGRLVELERAVPRPYVRVMEIAAGLHLGHARATGKRPDFHALGIGTPILIPLLALLGDRSTYTAADSTAPIVDGWSSPTISLYVDDPAPLKYKAYKIAQYWLAKDYGWQCACPYCRAFNVVHPPDVAAARRWWRRAGEPTLSARSLGRQSELSQYLPLLSHHPDDGIRGLAAMARVGHNHWILQRLERLAQRHATSTAAMRSWVRQVVTAYRGAPGADDAWKAATQVAWEIGDAAAAELAGAGPSRE